VERGRTEHVLGHRVSERSDETASVRWSVTVACRSRICRCWRQLEELDMSLVATEDDLIPGEAASHRRRRHTTREDLGRWSHLSSLSGVAIARTTLGRESGVGVIRRTRRKRRVGGVAITPWRGIDQLTRCRRGRGVHPRRGSVGEKARDVVARDDLDEVARIDRVYLHERGLERENVGVMERYEYQYRDEPSRHGAHRMPWAFPPR
jgi:hypothetical protein